MRTVQGSMVRQRSKREGKQGSHKGNDMGVHGPKNNHPVRRTIDEGKTSVRIVARVLATMYAGKERAPQREDG